MKSEIVPSCFFHMFTHKTCPSGKNMYKIYNSGSREVFSLKNRNRYLNIKGVTLDRGQLEAYMEKLAVNYETTRNSEIETYPINRLNDVRILHMISGRQMEVRVMQ